MAILALGLFGLTAGLGSTWGHTSTKQPAVGPAPPTVSENPADPPPPDAPLNAHYQFAQQMFAAGDYLAAATALKRAYAREPVPMLLYNIGQSYRRASHYTEAIEAYQKFLAVVPQHRLAASVRDHIRTVQLLLAQDEQRKQIELTMEQTQKELEQVKHPPIYKKVWFWATLFGGAATIASIAVGIKVYQDQRATDAGTYPLQF